MKLKKEYLIEPRTGISFTVKRNEHIRVIDVEGQQVADLIAFNQENKNEKLSTGATLDNNSSLFIKKGDWLFSNKYNKLLKVVEDTVEKHDILFPACSPQMFKSQYQIENYHPSCLENLVRAVKRYEISEEEIPTPLNIFMNTEIFPDGRLRIEEPISKAGDYIELRAEMDLIIGVTSCSVEESKCNAFNCTAIKIQIYS